MTCGIVTGPPFSLHRPDRVREAHQLARYANHSHLQRTVRVCRCTAASPRHSPPLMSMRGTAHDRPTAAQRQLRTRSTWPPLKSILFANGSSPPSAEACSKCTPSTAPMSPIAVMRTAGVALSRGAGLRRRRGPRALGGEAPLHPPGPPADCTDSTFSANVCR